MKFDNLYESFENERDIENLAKTIIDYYASFIMRVGVQNILNIDSNSKIKWDTSLDFAKIIKDTKFKAKTPELKELIKINFIDDIRFTNSMHDRKSGTRGSYSVSNTVHRNFDGRPPSKDRMINVYYGRDMMHTYVISSLAEYADSRSEIRYEATRDIEVIDQADSGLNPKTKKITKIKKGDILYIQSIRPLKDTDAHSVVELEDDAYYGIDALELFDKDIKLLKQIPPTFDKSILGRIYKHNVVDLLNQRYTTIVHELTHMIDDYQSDEKALSKKAKHKDDYKEYLRLPHEINARYTQTVSHQDLIDQKVNYPSHGHGRGGFEEYVREFKHKFIGWHDIDEKDRKHLIKRLFTEYNKFTKEEELRVINRGFNEIFWDMTLEPKTKVDWRSFYKKEKRLKADLKKIGHQVIKAVVKNRMKLPVLKKHYEGLLRALYALFSPTEKNDATKFQNEFKIAPDEMIDLRKRIREYGDSQGLYLF